MIVLSVLYKIIVKRKQKITMSMVKRKILNFDLHVCMFPFNNNLMLCSNCSSSTYVHMYYRLYVNADDCMITSTVESESPTLESFVML